MMDLLRRKGIVALKRIHSRRAMKPDKMTPKEEWSPFVFNPEINAPTKNVVN